MNIKEIAEKIRIEVLEEFGYEHRYTQEESIIKQGQERLISAYKAELLKEVGEPVAMTNQAQLGYVTDGMHPDIPLAMWAKETSYSGANIALYTSDQVAAAIAKATEPLEDQLAKAEQRVAEACALTYLEDYDLTDIAERVRAGEWRKFVKEV